MEYKSWCEEYYFCVGTFVYWCSTELTVDRAFLEVISAVNYLKGSIQGSTESRNTWRLKIL